MVTYNDVMLARIVFEKFWKQDLPFKLSEKIENFLLESNWVNNKVNTEKINLLQKYSKKDENDNLTQDSDGNVSFVLDNPDAFYSEFNNFLDKEVVYNFDEDNYLSKKDLNYLKCTPEEVSYVKWRIKK